MRLFYLLFFQLCLFLPILEIAEAQCLDSNGIGSFEDPNPMTSWFSATEGNGTFQVQSTEVYTGNAALYVNVNTFSNWQVRMFNRPDCYFRLIQGESYTISFNLKGPAAANMTVYFMDDLTNNVSQNITVSSTNWTNYTLTFTPTVSTDYGRLKITYKSVGDYYIDDITVTRNTNNWYVSPTGANNTNNGNGTAPTMPLQTIQYAINSAWEPGDTIFVMNGVYQNAGYGSGSLSNNAIVSLSGTTGNIDGWLVIKNYPGHQPKIQFDGSGGFVGGGVTYLEISGFEIEGPNQSITYADAIANRLIQDKYFSGRGIAVWSGHHIYIHDNLVHDCPNSGIRVNNGDYCTVSNNEVYNNTWWSSNAESAIVYATSQAIDTKDTIKMVITNNQVYDNYNNIPYYNSTYSGATSDYGTAAQNYIIDGSGCYITRNKDTYFYGWFYFANNVCYGNGINGVVIHKTNRAIATNNTVFNNGATPLSSGRQSAGGITVHSSADARVYNNISWARYNTDYGYKIYFAALSPNMLAANNILGKGLSDLAATEYAFADPLFVDTTNFDLRLECTSPGIDAGLVHANVPTYDHDGNLREPATPDIGAYEAMDSDSDGICDMNDQCPNIDDTLIGTACNDNDVCTTGDVYDSNCNCVGMFLDTDRDGVCNASDQCPGINDALIGTTCNDNDVCTTGDVYDGNCNCVGIFQDSDGDGICDANDCNTVQIDVNNFNNSWGIWNDGGRDCRRSRRDARYANGGTGRCVRLRDNTNTSVMTTDMLDLSVYSELTVNFNYYARSMDNNREDFWLQISTDGGATFTMVEEWNTNDEFINNRRYFESVVVSGPFSSTTQIRFRCDASDKRDWIYIDDVELMGCQIAPKWLHPDTTSPNNIIKDNTDSELTSTLALALYPNPFDNLLYINLETYDGKSPVQVELFDLTGRVVYQQTFYGQFITLNNLMVKDGAYLVRVSYQNTSTTKHLIKLK